MDIKSFFNSLTPEQIVAGNQLQLSENERVYNEFKSAYKIDNCSLCGKKLVDFIPNQPCFHWFLRPHGIKKKHFSKYLATPIGFFKFDSYIKWIANLESPFKNINDLKSEMNPAKVIEYTVRYKNIEWSVSIGRTDRIGHIDTRNANFPHFHIQMKIDGNIFIKFNDFHIPLSKEDLFTFQALEEVPEKVIWQNTYGLGMSILEENQDVLEQVEKSMIRTDDFENATFNTNTLIQMPQGQTMDGATLEKIFKESKETGTPVRRLLQKQYPQASIVTEIKPGDGVPEISKRTPRKS